MAYDVFVSYSTQDKLFADALVNRLENEKIRCWYAPRDIPPGVTWPGAIASALKQTPIMLLIFSSSANRSEEISRELTLASNNKCVVIPVRIENVLPSQALEYHLTNRHWLDVFDLELEPAAAQVIEVVNIYSGLLRGEAAPQGFVGGLPAGLVSRRRLLRRWLPTVLLLLALGAAALFFGAGGQTPPLQPAEGAPVYYYSTLDRTMQVRTLRLAGGGEPEHLVEVRGIAENPELNGIFHCVQSVDDGDYVFSTVQKGKIRIVFRVNYGNGIVYDASKKSFWVSYFDESTAEENVRDFMEAWEKQGRAAR